MQAGVRVRVSWFNCLGFEGLGPLGGRVRLRNMHRLPLARRGWLAGLKV